MREGARKPVRRWLRGRYLAWLAAALALALLQAIPNLAYPMGRDQATYSVIARGLLHGKALYRDLWDNKPPGIFYIYTAIVKIFGPAMWSVGVVDILWLIGISLCLFRFVERTLGRPAALLAVVVNAALHVRAGYWNAAQPETFLMLFVFAGYFLMAGGSPRSKLRHLCAGVLFAAAFWVKYNAIAFLPFVLLLPYLELASLDGRPRRLGLGVARRDWIRAACGFAAGFAAASAGLLFYLWFSGSWHAFLQEQFKVLPRYAATAMASTPHYWSWAAGRIHFWLGFWTVGAALAALLIAWRRRQLSKLTPALVGAAAGFAALAMQVRYQPYYFETCYPFFAVFWAYLGVEAYEGCRGLAHWFVDRNWRVAAATVWLVLAGLFALPLPGPVVRVIGNYQALNAWRRNPAHFYANYSWPGAAEDFRDVLRVVDYLNRRPAAGCKVYVWGNEPLIYDLTGREPPTRFVWNLALIARWRPGGWRGQFMRQLTESRPRWIVVASDDAVPGLSGTNQDSAQALREFPAFYRYLHAFYRPSKDFGTFLVYRRSGPERAPGLRAQEFNRGIRTQQ